MNFIMKIHEHKKVFTCCQIKLDVMAIFQNTTILQMIHYRWVGEDCMLPYASYKVSPPYFPYKH